MEYSLDQLRDLIDVLRNGKVGEFEYEDEKVHIRLNLGSSSTVSAAPVSTATQTSTTPSSPSATAAPVSAADIAFVTCPFVGTFYRSSSPESAPFVQPGQTIARGQTLCIVEAMKLMNEIESDVTGTLLEILVENGSNVEFGQRLFKVRKAQGT